VNRSHKFKQTCNTLYINRPEVCARLLLFVYVLSGGWMVFAQSRGAPAALGPMERLRDR
jgi:hypothetical protein